ncbi:aminomethyl transferase family protein [Halobellus rubicundus]|uniref:Aminomethyl transferase family protein n=1 Tax=Halobellus rubicundus TaxID=2996466 RepID=A0ABD5M771_9EURY
MGEADPDEVDESPVSAMQTANRREDFGGRRPGEYTHWIEEQLSWKETCYLGDWTFLANLRLTGPDALELLSDVSINSFDDYAVGAGKHLVQVNEDGDVVADGVLVREGEEEFVIHGVPSYWTAYHLEKGDYDADTEWRDTFNFQIQGPNSLKVLDEVAGEAPRDVDFMHFGYIEIAGHDVRAVRFGMSGEIGFELQGPGEAGEDVWNAILEAGQEYGIRRLSVKTSAINQLESGIPTRIRDYVSAILHDDMAEYRDWLREHMHRDLITHPLEGSFDSDDITDWYRDPVELGWDWYVDEDDDFIGSEALKEKQANPERTLVTLEWADEDVKTVYDSLFETDDTYKYMDMPHQQKRAMVADRVVKDGEDVGVATMRGYTYYFRKMLSLAVVDTEYAEPGTEVTVLWGEGENRRSPTVERHVQKEVQATVAETPYKKDRRRANLQEEDD